MIYIFMRPIKVDLMPLHACLYYPLSFVHFSHAFHSAFSLTFLGYKGSEQLSKHANCLLTQLYDEPSLHPLNLFNAMFRSLMTPYVQTANVIGYYHRVLQLTR
jgi:hypothetical protein